MDLMLIAPCYDEAARLPATPAEEYEVIVVDAGSTDDTVAEAETVAARWQELSVCKLGRNRGMGAAVRHGMLRASGRHRAWSDADLSTPTRKLDRLRAKREAMGKMYNRLLRMLVLPRIYDSQCCLKVFTASAATECFGAVQTEGVGFDAETLLRARRAGLAIAAVPVQWHHRDASRVSPGRDAARMLLDLARLRMLGKAPRR